MDVGKVDYEFCKALPKAELHAHISGSIRESTIVDFEQEDAVAAGRKPDQGTLEALKVVSAKTRSISQCFMLFDVIHSLITTPLRVRRVAEEVVQDFAKDNVKYLELRTTPRFPGTDGWSGKHRSEGNAYVEAVIDALEGQGQAAYIRQGMTVRLLLSCNRANGVAEARKVLELALKYSRRERFPMNKEAPNYGSVGEGWVVGIDFSGNPHVNGFIDFADIFEEAIAAGLSCSIHCGEAPTNSRHPRAEHQDNNDILDFICKAKKAKTSQRPNVRLGHVLYYNDAQWKAFEQSLVPVEVCPTSNQMVLGIATLKEHSTLANILRHEHPFSICTDDAGVLQTTLSEEYYKVGSDLQLSRDELATLARRSFDLAFAELDEASGAHSAL